MNNDFLCWVKFIEIINGKENIDITKKEIDIARRMN